MADFRPRDYERPRPGEGPGKGSGRPSGRDGVRGGDTSRGQRPARGGQQQGDGRPGRWDRSAASSGRSDARQGQRSAERGGSGGSRRGESSEGPQSGGSFSGGSRGAQERRGGDEGRSERRYSADGRGRGQDRDRRSGAGRPSRGAGQGDYRRGADLEERRGPDSRNYQRRGGQGRTYTDARDGYRPTRPQAPEIDEEVTGKELDRDTQRELSVLESQNAEGVARHLVMAMQYLEVDPAFALAHAQAAVRRGGRVAAVREAAGVAAYVAEDFEAALRELRTHRRMSGSHEHLALIIDCERALGRVEKALETAADPAVSELDAAAQAEVAMVVSGIHQDRGDLDAAKSALEIPGLDKKRAFSYSPRLFSAYADVLDALGQSKEAESWARLAVVAETALGQGQFAEPEIYEIDVLPEDEEAVALPSDSAAGQESAPSADEGTDSMGPEESLPSGEGQRAREDRVVADQPQPDSTEAETSPGGSIGPDGAGPDGAGSDGARPDSSGYGSTGSTAFRLSES